MTVLTRSTFIFHGIVSGLVGLVFLTVPGRFLDLFGWSPIDPIISRLLGAAFLALAWGSYRGWQALTWSQISYIVEIEAVFTVFSCVALLRHLAFARYPYYVWIIFIVFLLFAIGWIVALARESKLARSETAS